MLGAGGNICLQVGICLHDERNNMFVVGAQLFQATQDGFYHNRLEI